MNAIKLIVRKELAEASSKAHRLEIENSEIPKLTKNERCGKDACDFGE